MILNYEDLSPVHKAVEIEIPAELIERESRKVTSEFARQAKIPGFRPGKVPAGIVRSRFAKDIQEEVMKRLLPQTFGEAVREKGLEPVGDPRLEHMDEFVDGAPIKYKAEFDVKPQFELHEYRGLEVEEPKIEVVDADVDTMIDRLREQASVYRLETERGLMDGDIAVIDIVSTIDGVEQKPESGHLRMGEETPLPELHEAIFGRQPGEAVSIEKAYGDDATNEVFRGKTVRHDVTLKEIRVQEKPEVTEEFAMSVGGWESVAEMREVIGRDIQKHREAEALQLKRNRLGDRLVATHELEVPESLVDEELEKAVDNYARFLDSQGVEVKSPDMDWRKIAEGLRPEAHKRAKRYLILEAIAKKEGLTVSDVEVDAELRRAANKHDRDFAEVRHRMKHDGGYEQLRLTMAQEKAADFVLKESKTSEQ
jgi:trigger factor